VRKSISGVVAACLIFMCAEASAAAQQAQKPEAKKLSSQSGIASVYNYKGRRSASGEIINPKNLTAAHKSLRFGTQVRVTNRKNGRTVVVRIIDRGPFIRGRVIDLSPAAATALGFKWGLAPVTLSVLGDGKAS
jgi:rare lipoprotein A